MPPDPLSKLDLYNVSWSIPSRDAAGSMPIGNGEVVLNVWVEDQTGDLLFYIARTDALSEISRYLKLGRIRVHFDGAPLTKGDFAQRLILRDGAILIRGSGLTMRVFVDSGANVVHVKGDSNPPRDIKATLETWRDEPRKLPKEEQGSAWSVHDAPFDLIESADVIASGKGDVTWYHRNETSVVPKLWENQSLTDLKGTFDPILHRTFGGRLFGAEFTASGPKEVATPAPVKSFDLKVATASAQTDSVAAWKQILEREAKKSGANAEERTKTWWHKFWERSWVFADGDPSGEPVPRNDFPLRKGVDSTGGNVFPGTISRWMWANKPFESGGLNSDSPPRIDFGEGFSLWAEITPTDLKPGRIFDKMTAGGSDGFIFDTHPGDALRLIVGNLTLTAPHCLEAGKKYTVGAMYDPRTRNAVLILNGKKIAEHDAERGSIVTRGYVLQRFVQACQGRGAYPIKFNGGFYTVEPAAMGKPFSPDFRNWGDGHWWQNVRHMYHPMLASGDFEMMDPLFRMYESVVPLAKSRTKAYHGCEGVYFPETMTIFGTYSGGDYGWDRTGHEPKDVLCPWWQYAWNQGPELVALMLDRWDFTRDRSFLKRQVLPMAMDVLRYFDTRFKRDSSGRLVIEPTQVVETYWQGVVNDMPSTAGLIAITNRLVALPAELTTKQQREYFQRMQKACPTLPIEPDGRQDKLAPAQRYVDKTTNVENGELYAVWPFQLVSLSNPSLLQQAKNAYAARRNHLDVGWGYDGNVAALLGLTDEASRILLAKCRNSNAAYRWPATWGPNFDWLPDQNHGGNLLETTNLMLLQSEPLEAGGAIRVLPAWPKAWDVEFKLHADGNTTVRCIAKGGHIVLLEVTPSSRTKDVIIPRDWASNI